MKTFILLFITMLPLAGQIEINGIAAKVNGKVITKKEVDVQLLPIIARLKLRYPRGGSKFRQESRKAKNELLEQLIENKIVLSKAEELGASIPDFVIEEEEMRIISETFNGNKSKFREFLKEIGMSQNAFRKSQKEKILVQVFRQQQFGKVAPATEKEIRKHFNKRRHDLRDRSKDKVTYRKIFLRAKDAMDITITPESQLKKAEALAKKIRNGANFAELAKEESDGAYSDEGGLWERTPRTDLSPAFSEVLFDTPEGKVEGPLKDAAGFTIIKVIDKHYGPAPSYKEVRKRMKRELEIEKRSKKYKRWLKILKKNAMIERKI